MAAKNITKLNMKMENDRCGSGIMLKNGKYSDIKLRPGRRRIHPDKKSNN